MCGANILIDLLRNPEHRFEQAANPAYPAADRWGRFQAPIAAIPIAMQ
jgi:hypothetical protein